MSTGTLEKSPTHTQQTRAWLDLLRECLWMKSYSYATLLWARQYLVDYLGTCQDAPANLTALSAQLETWQCQYASQTPTPQDIQDLFNLNPMTDSVLMAERSQTFQAWKTRMEPLMQALNHLCIRTFRNESAVAHVSRALARTQQDFFAPPPASIKRTLKNIGFLEILLGETRMSAPPRWLILDQNNVCNFKCKMCQVHSEGNAFVPGYFTALDQLNSCLPWAEQITLGGTGEPLMHPMLGELLAHKTPDTHVTINTNASLVTKHADQLAKIDEIDVSFDGDNPETFETLRLGGNFEKTLEAIRHLKQLYPDKMILLNIVLSRLNVDELLGMAQWAKRLGVTYLALNPIYTDGALHFLRLRTSDRQVMFEQFRRIEAECPGVNVVSNIQDTEFISDAEDHPVPKAELLQRLKQVVPATRPPLPKLEELAATLAPLTEFPWWPLAPAKPAEPNQHQLATDTNKALTRERELGSRLGHREHIRLPYCLAPWLIAYLYANGTVKPCCFHNYPMDETIANKPLEEVWNSVEYQMLRESMLFQRDLPVYCRTCTSGMRVWIKDRLIQFAANYGFKYHETDDTLQFSDRLDLEIILPH